MTDEMQEHARVLIELNEPEALIESLRRVCQFKVDSFAEGLVPPEEGARWRTAANALSEATKTIAAAQEPPSARTHPSTSAQERAANELGKPEPVPAEAEASSTD